MERRAGFAGALYLLAMAGFVYGIANPNRVAEGVGFLVVLGGLALLHAGTGAFGRSWWLLVLPAVATVIAIPAGYPDTSSGEPLPIWFGMAIFIAPLGAILIAAGVVGARLAGRR